MPDRPLAQIEQENADLRQRLQDVNVKDGVKTREINILTQENRELLARLAVLEARPAEKLIAAILAEYPDELDKGACDRCDQCDEVAMCSFHSVLSMLQRHTVPIALLAPSSPVGELTLEALKTYAHTHGLRLVEAADAINEQDKDHARVGASDPVTDTATASTSKPE